MEKDRVDPFLINALVDEILETFEPGDLIPDKWLRKRMNIKEREELKLEDYTDVQALLDDADRFRNQYRSGVRALFEQFREEHKAMLVARHKEGFILLRPDEHVTRAYNELMDEIDDSIRQSGRLSEDDPTMTDEQRKKESDDHARSSWFVLMVPDWDD